LKKKKKKKKEKKNESRRVFFCLRLFFRFERRFFQNYCYTFRELVKSFVRRLVSSVVSRDFLCFDSSPFPVARLRSEMKKVADHFFFRGS